MRTLIIDDEKLAREIIKKYLTAHPEVEIIGECNNGFDAVKKINELNPDLIFLDIQMPKITGFEMLELLDTPPVIVFTTAYDQYAIKAFEVNAVDYLLKPFPEDRIKEAIEKVKLRLKEKSKSENEIHNLIKHNEEFAEEIDRVIIKKGSKITIIPVANINYIEAQDDYVMLYTNDGNFLKQKTMKYFESNLPANEFVRVHRSYIVKIDMIKEIVPFEKDSHKVKLKSGEKISVSKSGYTKLKEYLK